MVVNAPVREPASARSTVDESAFDESATRDPVEVLIKEARNRALRRRLVIGAVAAATVAVAAISVTASLGGGATPDDLGAVLGAPAGATAFGVFEPLRGRIVYVAGDELRAIDPADPTSVATVALPDELSDKGPVVAGWSADGRRLALTTEGSDGKAYVMDADGVITQARSELGCCTFVREPWLAPDGTTVLDLITAERLYLRDLGGGPSRVVELDPPVAEDLPSWLIPIHAWSPDGTRIAYTVDQQLGVRVEPSVYIVDLDSGATREMVGPGFSHIRHMTWSPDGSRLLVVAGPWRESTVPAEPYPLTLPQETGLYLVSTDSFVPGATSSPRRIASGHYIAATWSPDGDEIAAIDFPYPSLHRLVAMRSDGSASQVLVDRVVSTLFTGLAWHPIPSDR